MYTRNVPVGKLGRQRDQEPIHQSINSTIPFIPKKDRKRILSEEQRKRNKLRAMEIQTERLLTQQQNTALEAEIKRYK